MSNHGLPSDGWYEGNTDKMMANGTYADFRHMFVKKVELGKMKQVELDALDKEWEAIPLERKKSLRAVVVEQSTPKPVTIQTHDGPLTMMKSVPSEGNNIKIERQKEKVKREPKRALGALSDENSPLTVTPKSVTGSTSSLK